MVLQHKFVEKTFGRKLAMEMDPSDRKQIAKLQVTEGYFTEVHNYKNSKS